jgi:ketosteroid isomerase-like protein
MKRDEPLDLVRRLYDAWNAGDVAGAARLLSPEVRWENFGGAGAVTGREGLQTTLAGGSSGGTWQMSPMAVDVLVGVTEHVIAFTRRRGQGGEVERVEVWTLRDGAAVHYRGFPLERGLDVLTETTGSRRLEAVCRGVLAFNRGEDEGWIERFDRETLWPLQRLDDVEILADTSAALVISVAERREAGNPAGPQYLVIAFDGGRARRASGHATPDEALAAARAA